MTTESKRRISKYTETGTIKAEHIVVVRTSTKAVSYATFTLTIKGYKDRIMDDKEKYFDLTSQSVGTLQVTHTDGEEDERWFHPANGIGESRLLGVGEILLPYDAFLAVLSAIAKSTPKPALGQHTDNNPTNIGQFSDSTETTPPQPSDNGRTEEQRRADTQAARDNKRPPLTSAQIVKAYLGVVKMLENDRFIREVSGGVYKSYKELPKNCPEYIVAEINKAGHRRKDGRLFTQDTVSPIVSAMKIESKPSVFKVVYLVCLAVLISVAVTAIIRPGNKAEDKPKTSTEQTETKQIKSNFDFDKNKIKQICIKNKIQLTDYRRDLILAKTFNSERELEAEVMAQYKAMCETMGKQNN